jgi:ABC-type multidrug transport system fused ATPase/permease subunit
MVISTLFFSKRVRKAYRKTRKTIGRVSVELEENISGVRVAQAFSRQKENIAGFRKVNKANREANIDAETITAAFSPTLDVLSVIGTALVLGYGGYLALHGLITVGIIVAFLQYVRRFFQPVRAISHIWSNMQSAIAGAERIFELLEDPHFLSDADNAEELSRLEGRIEFKDVFFSYDREVPVLKGVSFIAEPGQTIALVGPTGAGKTTIINLIARFYDVEKGSVLIDGRDVRNVTRRSLRSQMGLVLQDTFLFSDTVMENIRYGRLDAHDEAVKIAASMANGHDFIIKLPEAYHTKIMEGGSNLSRGQGQLLSIARVVLADPRILILDEATSSVDTHTEKLIQQALAKLLKGRTSIVAAHRLSTIRRADVILVIKEGMIVERGKHEELLDKQETYYSIYKSQFKKAK